MYFFKIRRNGFGESGGHHADARLRPRSAPGPPRSFAPLGLRGLAVSRRFREDELDSTAFVASARVTVSESIGLVCRFATRLVIVRPMRRNCSLISLPLFAGRCGQNRGRCGN